MALYCETVSFTCIQPASPTHKVNQQPNKPASSSTKTSKPVLAAPANQQTSQQLQQDPVNQYWHHIRCEKWGSIQGKPATSGLKTIWFNTHHYWQPLQTSYYHGFYFQRLYHGSSWQKPDKPLQTNRKFHTRRPPWVLFQWPYTLLERGVSPATSTNEIDIQQPFYGCCRLHDDN